MPETLIMLTDCYEPVLNAMSNPSWLLTPDGSIIFANNAAKKRFFLDTSDDEKRFDSLVSGESGKTRMLLQMWSSSKSALPGNITFKPPKGDEIECLCKGNLIRPPGKEQPAIIFVQSTDKQNSSHSFRALNDKIEQLSKEIKIRKYAQQEITQLNKNLEAKVKSRTVELEGANDILKRSIEELEKAQSQIIRTERLASLGGMVAGVAHEINTPVGVCVTAASFQEEQVNHFRERYENNTLTRNDFESFLNVTSESSGIILANLDRAADLVKSFKQLAVDQTSDESRDIDMKSHIKELLASLKPYFRDTSHSHQLDCPDNIKIHSYPGSIAQVISNLIGNSIIHGFEGMEKGIIKIAVNKTSSGVEIHYSDNGKGIEKTNRKKIFDPFFTTKRNQGGTGLGMNIVYNLITSKLLGDIKLNGKRKPGAHFDIKLPFNVLNNKN